MNTDRVRDPFYNDRMDDPRLNSAGKTRGSRGFVEDLNDAIRENPVAAGLIGVGIAWFLFGNRTIGSALSSGADAVGGAARHAGDVFGDAWERTARSADYAAEGLAGNARDISRNFAGTASRTAKSATSFAQERISEASDQLSDIASEAVDYAGDASRRVMQSSAEFAGSAQENLKDAFERQPLLLGAVGLAIGVGLASAFPKTSIEEEYLGETSADVRARVGDVVHAANERANEVVSTVAAEAQRQGLTGSAAKEALSGLADKAKTVAGAAINGLRETPTKS